MTDDDRSAISRQARLTALAHGGGGIVWVRSDTEVPRRLQGLTQDDAAATRAALARAMFASIEGAMTLQDSKATSWT